MDMDEGSGDQMQARQMWAMVRTRALAQMTWTSGHDMVRMHGAGMGRMAWMNATGCDGV